MQNCIKLLKLTFGSITKICNILITTLQNNYSHKITDLNIVKDYYEEVIKFNNFCQNQLNEESFNNNLKNIYTTANKLINIFSIKIFKIINDNKLQDMSETLKVLPQLIFNLLANLSNYIGEENKQLVQEKNQLDEKLQNYSQQKINQESLLLINEGFTDGIIHGILRMSEKIFNIFTLKEKSLSQLNSTTGLALQRLSKKLDILNSKNPMTLNDYKDFFISREMGVIVGGLIASAALFIAIRKLYYKFKNYISEKWYNFKMWSKR